MFDPPAKLLLGFITGIAFGFLLQKGRVAKFPVIIGQFLLRDWTVFKVMLSAVAVGSIGVYTLVSLGASELHIKPMILGGIIFGGVLFGAGMALFGYCPGTSVAACGEGHRDAMVGVAGMIAGAFAYVQLYPRLQTLVQSFPDWGKVTMPEMTGTPAWVWMMGLVLAACASGFVFESVRRRWALKHA